MQIENDYPKNGFATEPEAMKESHKWHVLVHKMAKKKTGSHIAQSIDGFRLDCIEDRHHAFVELYKDEWITVGELLENYNITP